MSAGLQTPEASWGDSLPRLQSIELRGDARKAYLKYIKRKEEKIGQTGELVGPIARRCVRRTAMSGYRSWVRNRREQKGITQLRSGILSCT